MKNYKIIKNLNHLASLIFSILFLVIENISAQAITINIDSEQNTQKTFDGYVNKIVVSSGRQSFCQ